MSEENKTEEKKVDESKTKVKTFKGRAKKDFKFEFNEYKFELKKGEEFEMPELFKANMKTEKII